MGGEDGPSWRQGSLSHIACDPSVAQAQVLINSSDVKVPSFRMSKLYDREKEAEALFQALQRCIDGRSGAEGSAVGDIVLVIGPSGTGKTALVASALGARARELGGLLVGGKFDQLQRSEQYYPIVQAFTEYANFISRNPALLEEVKLSLVNIKEAETLLLDLIPGLEMLLGNDDASEDGTKDVPGTENRGAAAQTRLWFAIRQLLHCICSPARPLVFFLDDLQWAEPASLDLIASIVSDQIPGLLLVGACRGNEVALDHPLSVTLREIEANHVLITQVPVGNLGRSAVCQMIADALNRPKAESVHSLADLIWEQTDGNIFFVRQFLHALWEDGHLQYHPEDDSWSWDPSNQNLLQLCLGDSIALVTRKIERLDKSVQDVLMMASCFGCEFDEYLLHEIVAFDVAYPLSVAEDRELVARSSCGTWRFVHDQIQQSAYSLIPTRERDAVHLQIGRKLWEALPPDQLMLHVFLVVDQLRLGAALVTDQDERDRLAILLLRAGEKATASSSFLAASGYLNLGIEQLGPRHWRDSYDLSLGLFNAAAELEYCLGNYSLSDARVDEILMNARSLNDKTRALTTSIYSLGSRNELQKAIDLGFKVLEEYGVRFPKKPSVLAVLFELIKTKRALRRLSDSDILNLPHMRDPTKLAPMRIMNLMFAYCLNGRPLYAPLICMRLVQNSVLHGICGMSSVGFSAFAMMLALAFNEIDLGIRYGHVGLKILDKFQAREWLPRVYTAVYTFCLPFKEPLRDQLKPLLLSHRVGFGSGDLEFSMLSAACYTGIALYSARPLPKLVKDGEGFFELMKMHKQTNMIQFIRPNLQFAQNMIGDGDPCILTGKFMDERQAIREAETTQNTTVFAVITHLKVCVASFFQKYDIADEACTTLSKINLDTNGFSCFTKAQHWLHEGLVCVTLSTSAQKRRRLGVARRNLRNLKTLASHSKHNYLNKAMILEGEINAQTGRFHRAIELFDDAIDLGRQEELWHEVGLACERAAAALNDRGRLVESSTYLEKAVSAYERWGAAAKATDTKRRLLRPVPEESDPRLHDKLST